LGRKGKDGGKGRVGMRGGREGGKGRGKMKFVLCHRGK